MNWQDYALTVGSLILAAGLVPSLLAKSKPAFLTSLISGSVLLGFGFVFYTLSLWASASAVSIQGVLWLLLAYQKLIRKHISGAPLSRRQLKRPGRTTKSA